MQVTHFFDENNIDTGKSLKVHYAFFGGNFFNFYTKKHI